jgi:hypothetical protein
MTNSKFLKHRHHQMHINWALTNAHGNPALCCSECVQLSGKRAGKPAYIDWLNKFTVETLIQTGIEQRHCE